MATPDVPPVAIMLLKERVQRFYRALPRALSGDEDQLHRMRVAARRLGLALPLLASKPGGRRVRRALRALRAVIRAAGTSRDLDVAARLLDRHVSSAPGRGPEAQVLRRRLGAARRRSRRQMTEALLDIDIASLRRALRVVMARGGEEPFRVSSRLHELRDEQAARILAGMAKLGDVYEPERLHRLRIGIRRLRYATEVLDTLRGHSPGAPRQLRELQDVLGDMRDAFVLSCWLRRQCAAAEARGQAVLAAEARALAALFDAQSRQRHHDWLHASPAQAVTTALATPEPGRTSAA